MSSRSIGVTKVWLSRWMMSWVMRSPSCSQIRMSRASSLRSGKSLSISSSRPAARRMLPPASSKRSKNSRSRGARTLERRTGLRTVPSPHVEPGLLDAIGGQIADALAHVADRGPPVVLDAAQLDAAVVVQQRVGGAVVAIERHAHAAGVHERDAGRTLTLELEMGV